jgi:CheY-like chemotaxis protein
MVTLPCTRVLVVDDRPDVRLSLMYMLEASGFEVAEAGNGVEALNVMSKNPVAVILTDLRMPGMGGPELAKHVTQRGHRRPRLILMSGSVHLAPDSAATLGVDAILAKPFTREQLVQTIRAAR